jgi:WD40 repeat protein
LIDVETGQERDILRANGRLRDFAVSPDGQLLATIEDATLRLRDLASKQIVREMQLPGSYGHQFAFSPNGKRIGLTLYENPAVKNTHKWISVLNVDNLQEVARIDNATGGITALAFSPDATKLATSAGDGSIIIWNLSN